MKKIIIAGLYTVGILLFWIIGHPEAISYHEQYQLFLFTKSYLLERIAVAGGLTDYIAEFITQFYYVTILGAVLHTCLFLMLQQATWKTCKAFGASEGHYALSVIPGLLMLAHMGDENVTPSFIIAICEAIGMFLALARLKGTWLHIAKIICIPLFYWIAGPAMLIMVVLLELHAIKNNLNAKQTAISAGFLAYSALVIYAIFTLFMTQYPWPDAWGSVNYHRVRLAYPMMQHIVMATAALLPILVALLPKTNKVWVLATESVLAAIGGGFLTYMNYDTDKFTQIKYDYLVRYERWDDIIKSAEKYQPKTVLASNSVNLALAMKGQLSERMFEFYQNGTYSLFSPFERNMVSCLPSAEAYFRLGMINSALRCYFDSQEAILNARKSGRMTKRIAEGYLVNGRYDVAQKYLNILKNTIFYSSWAKETESLLCNEELINQHPVYGKIRRERFKTDGFYSTANLSQMLARLWNGCRSNDMAFDYMMANIMLNCNMEDFYNVGEWLKEKNYIHTPRHIEEAMAMFWLQGIDLGHGLEASNDMKKKVKQFDTAYLMSSNREKFVNTKWGKTYWAYCMILHPMNNEVNGTTGATHRTSLH